MFEFELVWKWVLKNFKNAYDFEAGLFFYSVGWKISAVPSFFKHLIWIISYFHAYTSCVSLNCEVFIDCRCCFPHCLVHAPISVCARTSLLRCDITRHSVLENVLYIHWKTLWDFECHSIKMVTSYCCFEIPQIFKLTLVWTICQDYSDINVVIWSFFMNDCRTFTYVD